ncbi:MAG: TlpA family protein disulfide reductase [Gemmatimonadetes bacterium]|nr:TlpA family protein disulfide reductase [Gemmatimonadota bacterium]
MRSIIFVLVLLGLTGCSGAMQHSLASAAGERSGSDATAPAGTLTFIPDRPRPGQRVEAVYRPAKALAGEPLLHLRARLRTPQHDSYNDGLGSRTVAVLERQRDGTYRSSLSLPAGVVYSTFAVENVEATHTDSREGRFWELLVHDSEGRPVFEALEQRFNDYMGRDELAVLGTAREMVEVYPDHPAGWSSLRAAEGWVLGEQDAEERLAKHQERLRATDRALAAKQDVTANEIGYLYWNARALQDDELTGRWRERLLAEHPGHFFAVQERVIALRREHREDSATLLRELEVLWALADGRQARERIVGAAFAAARNLGDAGAVLVWADRYADLDPKVRAWVANRLSDTEATREEGILWLQTEISRIGQAPDQERPLGATAAEHRESTTRRVAELRASLGRPLLAAGRAQAGIAALDAASAVGWNTSRFRTVAEARLSTGDREGGIRAFAAVAADPGTSGDTADSLRLALDLAPLVWEEAISRARAEMLQRTLQSARTESLASVNLAMRNGSLVRLEQLIGGGPTVVVFWSRYCGYSVQAMQQIVALAEHLAGEGVQLLAVTRDSPADAESYLREGGWDMQVLFDTDGEAARALNSWGTPQYFVLDAAGRLRFAFSSLEDLPRQVAALRTQESRSDRTAKEPHLWAALF